MLMLAAALVMICVFVLVLLAFILTLKVICGLHVFLRTCVFVHYLSLARRGARQIRNACCVLGFLICKLPRTTGVLPVFLLPSACLEPREISNKVTLISIPVTVGHIPNPA